MKTNRRVRTTPIKCYESTYGNLYTYYIVHDEDEFVWDDKFAIYYKDTDSMHDHIRSSFGGLSKFSEAVIVNPIPPRLP